MICPGEEQLEKLAAGELTVGDAESVIAHVSKCSRCARFVAEYPANQEVAEEYQDAFSGEDPSLGDVSLSGLLSDTPERIEEAPDEPPAPGELPPEGSIPGYQIIREIHRGGQGVVYEAIQLSTKRTVAVKVLLEGPFASERSRRRFEREVDLVAHMKHPHIVPIHDSGITLGRCFFAMDYVCGQPLDTHVRVKSPTVRDTVRLFIQVCDAVSYAHRHGIIHRDLKPSNILVDEECEPQVLDFGLAKILANGREGIHDSLVTMPGQIMGTLHYMSPEQTRGDPEAIDTRTDVYTLGVILYELLAGAVPYPTNVEITEAVRNIREVDPPSLSRRRREVSADLEAVIRKAMHKDPDRRYLSGGELAEDLRAWLDGRPVTAKSDSAFYVLRKLAARHYFHTSVIVALLAAIVGFGGIAFQALLKEKRTKERVQDIDQDFAAFVSTLESQSEQATANGHQALLGYFLLEWYGDRLEAARAVQRLIPENSAEAAVTRFLLDGSLPVSQLQETPGIAESLVLFATGERHFKARRWAEAADVFKRYVEQFEGFYEPLAQARLWEANDHMKREASSHGP